MGEGAEYGGEEEIVFGGVKKDGVEDINASHFEGVAAASFKDDRAKVGMGLGGKDPLGGESGFGDGDDCVGVQCALFGDGGLGGSVGGDVGVV